MNYCILNGKKSTLVKGLLIQSLPSITKPLMRTRIEDIDGRDGDIITKLGYAAYDKTMKIGLFGDYDVDEVIAYFDQSGRVIFSNELDKYYRYDIFNQIDLEKLLRFREANITFHCQPFKYSAVDEYVELTAVGHNQVDFINRGNIYSRPRLYITGNGSFTISLNGTQLFSITGLTEGETIIIDGEQMNAYKNGAYANRSVSGDYSKLKFNTGKNTITWSGTVYQIAAENFVRWI